MINNGALFSQTIVLALICSSLAATFTNDWVVHLKREADPDTVAEQHGFENLGQLHEDLLDNVYHFRHKELAKRHSVHRREVTDQLNQHEMILRSEQDEVLQLEKRSYKRHERYNDPSWDKEWYLNSEDSGVFEGYEYNINVQPAWDKGYNGSGVVVCVIDDGLEKDHHDLAPNYDPLASYDLQGDDNDPSPRYAYNEPNRHGTRCAGEIASVRNNHVCGVGVAHACNIGGIRILDGPVTRIMESKALGFNLNYVDIFSASWGPPDNGKAMDGPKGITKMTIEEAMKRGRGGKGALYVWAGGNGGKNDDCNADGYQTMRWSISISAVGLNGDTPYYAEPCASALAATFSSGFVRKISTTDIHGKCTNSHSGTSAAAPIVSGIVALAVQARPDLHWRDVQHIILRAAIPDKLYHHEGWVRNAVGRATHIHFGYGILDASRMVDIAKNWTLVGPDHQCESPKLRYDKVIPAYSYETFDIRFDGCENTDNVVKSLEHVYVELDLSTPRRGDVAIDMVSPSGTHVGLMSTRAYDWDSVGFKNWRLMTTFLFGEDPNGVWKVTIKNNGKYAVKLNSMFLDVFGTEESPKETSVSVPNSNDITVCDELCGMAEKAYYDSAARCKSCINVVRVDIERRNGLKTG